MEPFGADHTVEDADVRLMKDKSSLSDAGRHSALSDFFVFLKESVTRLSVYPSVIVGKLYLHWRRYGFRYTMHILREYADRSIIYRRWYLRYDSESAASRAAIIAGAKRLSFKPLISILMPVWNSPEQFLRLAIESVLAQSYSQWELCIADDASTAPHVREVLEEYARRDSRIKLVLRGQNGHISEASNSALEICGGDYVALLDHDDELASDALYWVAVALNDNPNLQLIYSDEDKIDRRGKRFGHYFKPDWNPDLFLSQNMVSHLGVYRTATVRAIGGFRKGYEGCQDWDLALRVSEKIESHQICHIPRVLYHWRTLPGSTAVGPEQKSYVTETAHRVIADHLARRGVVGMVSTAFGSYVRVAYPLPIPLPVVSVIVNCTDYIPLTGFWKSLVALTDYSAIELIACVRDQDTQVLKELENDGVRAVSVNFTSNESVLRNVAAEAARGDILCFLSSRMRVTSSSWLRELCSHAARREVGVVGAMVLASRDRNGRKARYHRLLWR
jgi:glycosyltransferase involved in cell wall biosynthesis